MRAALITVAAMVTLSTVAAAPIPDYAEGIEDGQEDGCKRQIWGYPFYRHKPKLVPCSEADKIDRSNKAKAGVGIGVVVGTFGAAVGICHYAGLCDFRFRGRSPVHQDVNGDAEASSPHHVAPEMNLAPIRPAAPIVQAAPNLQAEPLAQAPIVHAAPAVQATPATAPVPTYQDLVELADNMLHSPEVSPPHIFAHVGPRSLPNDDALLTGL